VQYYACCLGMFLVMTLSTYFYFNPQVKRIREIKVIERSTLMFLLSGVGLVFKILGAILLLIIIRNIYCSLGLPTCTPTDYSIMVPVFLLGLVVILVLITLKSHSDLKRSSDFQTRKRLSKERIQDIVIYIVGLFILLYFLFSCAVGISMLVELQQSWDDQDNTRVVDSSPTPTADWVATVDSLSTAVAHAAMSPEQIEAAIATTLQAMILEAGGAEALATILPNEELPVVATAVAETITASTIGCPELLDPIDFEGRFEGPNILVILFTVPYSVDPANCFEPHHTEDGWFVAGWTRITIGDDEPKVGINTWYAYHRPAIREWDGTNIIVGDIIDLYRMDEDFQSLWAKYDNDISVLSIEMYFEDFEGHSAKFNFHHCPGQREDIT
jgi:hypothetical protein